MDECVMLSMLLLFLVTSLLFAMLPGPDFALILRTSLIHGKRQALSTSLGIACGLCVHTALSVLGLSAVIAHSPFLFACITYAGAAYLAYIGLHALFSRPASSAQNTSATGERQPQRALLSNGKAFQFGFLTNVLNPKAILFYLTFLPQFLVQSAPVPIPGQLLLLGLCSCLVTGGWFIFLSCMLSRVRRYFENETFRRWLERVTGCIFLGFSVKLLATSS